MALSSVKENKSVGYGLTVDGETLFGAILNVTKDSEASSFSMDEIIQIIREGKDVVFAPLVKKERDTASIRAKFLKTA